MSPEHQLVREVYSLYRKGDHIPDEMLNSTLRLLPGVLNFLSALGERFHHAWLDLHTMHIDLKSFKEARKPNSVWNRK